MDKPKRQLFKVHYDAGASVLCGSSGASVYNLVERTKQPDAVTCYLCQREMWKSKIKPGGIDLWKKLKDLD